MAVYVDDLNIICTTDAISKIVSQLKYEFELKDLGETTFCLHVEHLARNIFVHYSFYTQKLLKCFSIYVAHSLSSPMVVRSLDIKKDEFRPCDEGGEMFRTCNSILGSNKCINVFGELHQA